MDKELKQRAELLFSDMGLSMDGAFTLFTKAVVRQGKIPFEIAADPFYSAENQTRLRKAVAALNEGQGSQHELIEPCDA
jgi:DNA-damage-inducible protein J